MDINSVQWSPGISRALATADSTEIMKKLLKFMYDEEKALEISRALAAADSTEIMKKLPKFMYNEEKALEEDQALAKEATETVVLVIDEEGVESLIRICERCK
ncbi:hypothetical protein HN51_005374 [Arachis hypogaea]|uniref:Uncharacterized protein n=1 Tax=Arachis hypogaea TaxID=3818 RepID=A0A445DEW5_ARAHY|nr:uncharacterized protein LOC114927633 [Arachis hypogaea]RYR61717.1 hypothetical protein Ahy_A04g018921 [Arachis hypogaea]